jgi:hypothetical protein
MDESRSVDILDVEHHVLGFLASILFEHLLLQLHVLLIIGLVGVEVPFGVKGAWFLVLAVEVMRLLPLGQRFVEFGESGFGFDH